MRRDESRGLWKDSPSFYKLLIPNTVAGTRYRQMRMANYGQFITVAMVMITMVLFVNYRIINNQLADEQLTHKLTKRNFEATAADQLSRINGLQSHDAESKSKIESLQSDLHKNSDLVIQQKSQLEEKLAQYEDSLTQIKQLSDSLDGSSLKNDELTKDIIGLQNMVDNLKGNVTTLLSNIGEEQNANLNLRERFTEIVQEKEKVVEEDAYLKEIVNSLNNQVSQLKNELQLNKEELYLSNKENGNLKAELQNSEAHKVDLTVQNEANAVEAVNKPVIDAPVANPQSANAQEGYLPIAIEPVVNVPAEDSNVIEEPEDRPLEVPQVAADETGIKTAANQGPGIRMVRDVENLGVNENYNQHQYVDDPKEEQDDLDNEHQVVDSKEEQAVGQNVDGGEEPEQDDEPDYGPVKREDI